MLKIQLKKDTVHSDTKWCENKHLNIGGIRFKAEDVWVRVDVSVTVVKINLYEWLELLLFAPKRAAHVVQVLYVYKSLFNNQRFFFLILHFFRWKKWP